MDAEQRFSCRSGLRDLLARRGLLGASAALVKGFFEIARDYLPARRRSRFGDLDFDWDHRVDTTWSNLPFGTRIRELLAGRPYQPTDPLTFHEMMLPLAIRFPDFTFLDLGSGKARALLMASDYPFRRIVGVELLPELHAIARDNLRRYRNNRQQCRTFELHCCDARQFPLPPQPLVIFLFDPFPPDILRQIIARIEQSGREFPRPIYLLYQNPISKAVITESPAFRELVSTIAYAIFELG